jgi:membrane-associated phospholipid phosphatase
MAVKLELERGRWVAVDKRWYLNVNQFAKTTPWAHGFMTAYYERLLSPAGAGLLFLALLVIVGWWTARRHPEHEAAVIWTALGALVALGLSQLLAQALARPRPYQVLKGVEVLVPRVSGYGLPSGRAAVAGAVVCGLLLAGRWRLALVALLAGGLLVFAGVYVGVDYPSAGAGGALFGAAVVLVLWPLVAWLLSALVTWVGTSPFGRVFAVRGSMKKPVNQWAMERPSRRMPDAKAMEALRAASEAAHAPAYKHSAHDHVKA